jgi:hypothetical protein
MKDSYNPPKEFRERIKTFRSKKSKNNLRIKKYFLHKNALIGVGSKQIKAFSASCKFEKLFNRNSFIQY